jgi:aryl-alcohol dehydrogenase-like predicted oxidoreductase
LQNRCLGNTGFQVSPIGLGTVKFGRNQGVKYPAAFELPSDQAIIELLAEAKALGVNLLDTAPAYGSSEERLGKLLKGQRHDWILATKVGESFQDGNSWFDFSSDAIVQSVDRSLQRLRTDFLDIVLVHSNGDDLQIIREHEVFVTLDQLKKAGKLRAFGMSTKTVAGGLLTIQHADVAMVTHHPQHTTEIEVIRAAHQQNKGILIKKALASGHMTQSPRECIEFALAEPGVTSVIVGTINAKHLRENAGVS